MLYLKDPSHELTSFHTSVTRPLATPRHPLVARSQTLSIAPKGSWRGGFAPDVVFSRTHGLMKVKVPPSMLYAPRWEGAVLQATIAAREAAGGNVPRMVTADDRQGKEKGNAYAARYVRISWRARRARRLLTVVPCALATSRRRVYSRGGRSVPMGCVAVELTRDMATSREDRRTDSTTGGGSRDGSGRADRLH